MWLKSYLDMSPDRPRWAFIADALIERSVVAAARRTEDSARQNYFLQTWEVNTSTNAGMPRDLARMIRTAKKYGVIVDVPNPAENLKKQLPIWYHFGLLEGRSTANSKTGKCLRNKHNVRTVADCVAMIAKAKNTHDHVDKIGCNCDLCNEMAAVDGCEHPPWCTRAAERLVGKLRAKWRPTEHPTNDGLSLTPSRKHGNREARGEKGALLFNPSASYGASLGDAIRVFAKDAERESPPARRKTKPYQIDGEAIEVYTDGSCIQNGEENASAGAGVYFGHGDCRNAAERVPGEKQSNQAGEVYAVALAADRTPIFTQMTIITD
ncbi:hypothetical protein C2E23DRAFT_910558, partial [Lenzites betulinus]